MIRTAKCLSFIQALGLLWLMTGLATASTNEHGTAANLTVYTFALTWYDGSNVVHQETAWETVAADPATATAYASNHLAVVSQQLESQGKRVSRSSGVIVAARPSGGNSEGLLDGGNEPTGESRGG